MRLRLVIAAACLALAGCTDGLSPLAARYLPATARFESMQGVPFSSLGPRVIDETSARLVVQATYFPICGYRMEARALQAGRVVRVTYLPSEPPEPVYCLAVVDPNPVSLILTVNDLAPGDYVANIEVQGLPEVRGIPFTIVDGE